MLCPHCNAVWPDELKDVLKFCGSCGQPMTSEPPTTPPRASSDISTSDPGGELRFVTVVFADLADFTAFAEDRAPDEVSQIVGDFLQCLGRVVEQHGGAVDKFLGDAVVALFGLPRPDPDAARNAVRAGIAMQAAAAQFNREHQLNFGLRVGIHAGEVMFRAIGGSWTVMGDTVNTASRIQNAAKPGMVWISRPIYEKVRRFFILTSHPAVQLKGKKEAIQPYEVVGERSIPFMNLPRFVGREREWSHLLQCLESAVQNRTLRVVILRGPAGVGKSRLVWELRDWIQRQPETYAVDVVQYDHSERLPAHGLNSIIRKRFDLALGLPEDTLLAQLKERMPSQRPGLTSERRELAAEFFAFVLGVAQTGLRISDIDGRSKWDSAFIELKGWLETRASQTPWIWFLEDVQKGDAETAAFLDWALNVQWSAPLLFVVTAREEDLLPDCFWYAPIARWEKDGRVDELRLKEIPTDQLAQALTTMAEGEVSLELAQHVAERAEGNPLFATELILYLKEHGLLATDSAFEQLRLPASIREVMEARIERLGRDGKEVAKRGSLMGRRFTREAVDRIWDYPHAAMENGFAILRETETIYEETSVFFSGEKESVFRHGRLQEAVLARIPREERARWLLGLEKWARGKLAELARHSVSAGAVLIPLIIRSREEQADNWQASLWYEVLGFLHAHSHRTKEALRAFQKAFESSAGVRQLVICRQVVETELFDGQGDHALQILENFTQTPAEATDEVPDDVRVMLDWFVDDPLAHWETITHEQAAIMLELTRANALTSLGHVTKAQQVYTSVETRLRALRGETCSILWLRWGRALSYLLSELMGDPRAAEKVCADIRRRINFQDPALAQEAGAFIAAEDNFESRLGHYARAKALAQERLAIAEAAGNFREQANAWNSKAIVADSLGEIDAAGQAYDKSLEISRSIGYRRGEVIALHNLANVFLERNEPALAIQQLEQYLALSRITGNHLAEAYAPLALASASLQQAQYDRAESYVNQARQMSEQNNWVALVGMAHSTLGQCAFCRWLDEHRAELLGHAIQSFRASEQVCPAEQEGEFYASLALALFFDGQRAEAQAVIARTQSRVDESWVVGRYWLNWAEKVIAGQSVQTELDWFSTHGLKRAVQLIQRVNGGPARDF